MGNASTRDKNRHVSGDDQGPTMKVAETVETPPVTSPTQCNVTSPMEDIQTLNTEMSTKVKGMGPESTHVALRL